MPESHGPDAEGRSPAPARHADDPHAALEQGYDEAYESPGVPRPHYAPVLEALAGCSLEAIRERVARRLAAGRVSFGEGGDPFAVDPVPRLLTAQEWAVVSAGVAQRVRALDAFVRDAYGAREIVRAGLMAESTIEQAGGYEPGLRGRLPEHVPLIGIAGLDLVRCHDGSLMVLEDNARTPSGYTYALAARRAVEAELPLPVRPEDPDVPLWRALAGALRAVAPEGVPEPASAVLTDGPHSPAYYEHRQVARRLGMPLLVPSQLECRDGRLVARDAEGRRRPVDVIYRRTDEHRLEGPGGSPTWLGELLGSPWRAGRVGVVNGFGTGVADDKGVHRHVEDMVRLYLGEDPVLRSVPAADLLDERAREAALERLPELVVKPRGGAGGEGVVVGPHAGAEDLERTAGAVRRHPEGYVAQPTIALSRHPTVVGGGRLGPRHVDLRPYGFNTGQEVAVPPLALTRVALEAGALVVNSSRGGGAKDTWVLAP